MGASPLVTVSIACYSSSVIGATKRKGGCQMKCPKCGFTSFDYLMACKKCGYDLSTVRASLGVISIAPEEKAVASPRGPSFGAAGVAGQAAVESAAMAGFEPTSAQASVPDQDFDSFDNLVEPTSYAEKPKEEEESVDIFGDLQPTAASAAPEPAPAPKEAKPAKEEDEEFLDLDFGGIFEEEKK